MPLLVKCLWDLKYFGGKLPTGKKETGKLGQGIYTIVRNLVTCMWIQLCIRHSGVYRGHSRDVKGRLFVSYESYSMLLKYVTSWDGRLNIIIYELLVRWDNH